MKKAMAFAMLVVPALALSVCGLALSTALAEAETKDFSDAMVDTIQLSNAMVNQNGRGDSPMIDIKITVGGSSLLAKLYDNDATKALLAQFPLTLDMSDLNGNEKYFYLAEDLATESMERPETIDAGDIMCWSGNCLVLFYKTFSNTYGGYIRLGYVEDAASFSTMLGEGNVQVSFLVDDYSSTVRE